jgi:heme o synthase
MKGIAMNRSGGLMTSKPMMTSEALVLIEPPTANGYGRTAMDAVIVPSPRVSLSRAMDFVTLTKPEITLLVVLATGLGTMMASTVLDHVLFLHVLCGTALLASGSATLNQYLERGHDAKMRRTASRPLPAGRVTPREALYFGLGLSLLGLLYLAFTLNALTSLIGLVALLSYLLLYAPLKRRTPLCILIGAFPGAAPVLMGWSAVHGGLAPEAWLLFAILFLWQFPHVLAIAWIYREDYAQAGMLMLPSGAEEGGMVFRQLWIASLALSIAALLPGMIGMTGRLFLYCALVLDLGLLFFVARVSSRRSKQAARRLLHATVLYLPLLYAVMVLDKAG